MGDTMKSRRWLVPVGLIVVFGLLSFVGFQWWAPSLSAENLTIEEVNQIAKDKYPGTIIKTTKNDGEVYQIEMQLETGVYQIRMDAESGEVNSIKRKRLAEETSDHATEETTKKHLKSN